MKIAPVSKRPARPRTRLDKQFDRLIERERAGHIRKPTRSRFWGKFRSNGLAMFGLFVFVIIVTVSICAPLLTWNDPSAINLRSMNTPPNWDHPFGTDRTGRDIFARVLYGGAYRSLSALARRSWRRCLAS